MEQKELFHFGIFNAQAFFDLFFDKRVDYFDVISFGMRSPGLFYVGIFCKPRDLFWIGFLLKSYEDHY